MREDYESLKGILQWPFEAGTAYSYLGEFNASQKKQITQHQKLFWGRRSGRWREGERGRTTRSGKNRHAGIISEG
jgi:hypothetical protein